MELMIVIVIIAILVGVTTPSISKAVTTSRVNKAAEAIGSNFETAFSLAARYREPMVLKVDPATSRLTITNYVSGKVQRTVDLGPNSEFQLSTIKTSVMPQNVGTWGPGNSILVYPTGTATGSLWVTLSTGTNTRQVYVYRAGKVRIP